MPSKDKKSALQCALRVKIALKRTNMKRGRKGLDQIPFYNINHTVDFLEKVSRFAPGVTQVEVETMLLLVEQLKPLYDNDDRSEKATVILNSKGPKIKKLLIQTVVDHKLLDTEK